MSFDAFIWRAIAGGVGVALLTGPLGCFVIWRRMAYFGDSLAHSALLGVALGFLLGTDLILGVIATCVAFAAALVLLQQQRLLATDTLLGILSYTALSLGLIVVGLLPTLRVDLPGYLFGDILAIGRGDLAWIYGAGAPILAVVAVLWRPLLAITVHEELARAEGVPVLPLRLGLMLVMAVTVALAMKVIGILLITALLVIPAAAARRLARTPEQMAGLAMLIGSLAVIGGILGSLRWDTPSGPSIVVVATVLFLASLAAGRLTAARRGMR